MTVHSPLRTVVLSTVGFSDIALARPIRDNGGNKSSIGNASGIGQLTAALGSALASSRGAEVAGQVRSCLAQAGYGTPSPANRIVPPGCHVDDCGNAYVMTSRGKVSFNADTVTQKFMGFSGTFTPAAGGQILSFRLKAQVSRFLITNIKASLAATSALPQSYMLAAFKVGTTDQDSGTIDNSGGFTDVGSFISLDNLRPDAQGTEVSLDVLESNLDLNVTVKQVAIASPPATATLTVNFFGYSLNLQSAYGKPKSNPAPLAGDRVFSWEVCMGMIIQVRLDAFDDSRPLDNCDTIRCLVECFAKINASIIKRRYVPSLYTSGVRYREEEEGKETFRDCMAVLKAGYDDCNNLTAYRMGELIARGVDCQCLVDYNKNNRGGYMYHVYLLNRGEPEDPSLILGMR